ncbi:MAG: hypothetical protein RTU63_11510 [Candidatus Thorarchaeota archaeon]
MCDSHHPRSRRGYSFGYGMHPKHFMMMGECCDDHESKDTKIKRLEAHKSHLNDRIGHIDQRIAELQKQGEGEEV